METDSQNLMHGQTDLGNFMVAVRAWGDARGGCQGGWREEEFWLRCAKPSRTGPQKRRKVNLTDLGALCGWARMREPLHAAELNAGCPPPVWAPCRQAPVSADQGISEAKRIHMVLFVMNNRTFGPCLTAMHSLLISAMHARAAPRRRPPELLHVAEPKKPVSPGLPPPPFARKVRVLVKEPKGRDVEEGDVFSFNEGFTGQLYRIKINSIQLKETPMENKKTNDQVIQDRQYQVGMQ
jgi:uncharacterized protein YkvS